MLAHRAVYPLWEEGIEAYGANQGNTLDCYRSRKKGAAR
jgi:hypothetical protein